MAVFVFRKDPLQPPHDIGIVVQGVQVHNELPSVAHACAMLFGLIYALHLRYQMSSNTLSVHSRKYPWIQSQGK